MKNLELKKLCAGLLSAALVLPLTATAVHANEGTWEKVGKAWKYTTSENNVATGWYKVDNCWYYANEDGITQTGWQLIEDEWYYLNPANSMLQMNQWLETDEGKFFVDQTGKRTMEEKQVAVENDGRTVFATLVLPASDEAAPLVVMNHGFGGYRDEGAGFVNIASALAEQGIASVRLDFAGCGASQVSFAEFKLSNNIADSNAIRDYVIANENIDKNKLGIFGYSFGGRASVMITHKENPYKAMALLAPHVSIVDKTAEIEAAKETGTVDMPWFGNTLTVSLENYQEEVASNKIMKRARHQMPTLLISGTEDVMVPHDVCKKMAEQIDAEFVAIENADHGYAFYGGNPEHMAQVVNATAEFFVKQFK